MKSLMLSLLFQLLSASELYKYKLIDSQERPRRSDAFGPGQYLQKESFFKSGFLEDLFGFGRPEPSFPAKRENNIASRYPYHGQPFGPSPPQNTQYNPYIAPSPILHDPQPFASPFYSVVPVKSNERKPTLKPIVNNPTANPYTYKVPVATNPQNLKNPAAFNFPFQPVSPAYGYNTTPVPTYPSTSPPTHSNIESQYQSTPKPHHVFSSSSSPQYENSEPKLDQFFTMKPFVHKVKPFVHKVKPENIINIGKGLSISKPKSTQPEGLIQHPQPVNYNVIQDRPYPPRQETFHQTGNREQHLAPYVPQQKYPGQDNYANPLPPQVHFTPNGPSMESLLTKIDINSQRHTQNAPLAQANLNNLHLSFTNGLQQHSITQQSDTRIKHQFQEPQMHINPNVQQNHQILQLPHKTKTTISKPEQYFMVTDAQKDNNQPSAFGQNKKTHVDIMGNKGKFTEQSFDVFHPKIEQQTLNKSPIQGQQQNFLEATRNHQPKDTAHQTLQDIKKPSPYSYSLLSNLTSNQSQTSFQQVAISPQQFQPFIQKPVQQNYEQKLQPFVQKPVQQNYEQKLQPFQNAQSFVHKSSANQNIQQIHPFVEQTSMVPIGPQQKFQSVLQMENHSHQQQFQQIPTVQQNPQQKIQPMTDLKIVQKQQNSLDAMYPKKMEALIETTPRFVYNIHDEQTQNPFNQQYPSLPSQSPIKTNPTFASNSLNSEKLFPLTPSPPVTTVHLGTSFNKEITENSVQTSGSSSKLTPEEKLQEWYAQNSIQPASVSQPNLASNSVKNAFKEVHNEVMHTKEDNNERQEVSTDQNLYAISLSQQSIPKDTNTQQHIDKSFDTVDKSGSKNELFTSFPSRDKATKYTPTLENKKKVVQKEPRQKIKKIKQDINKTRRKPTNLEDKQVNKAEVLQKLMAIAGGGWDTEENIEKSLNKRFKCPKPEGHFADPDKCEVYYRCVHGTSTRLQCGAGLKWNSKTNQCDWGDNVDCGLNRVPRSKASVMDKK